MNKDAHRLIVRLVASGIAYDDALALRRIAMTLHRWHELECGDGNDSASWCIERDEKTGKPYRVVWYHSKLDPTPFRYPIADREKGALRRLNNIVAKYLGTGITGVYVQTDPRGAPLYLLRKGDVPEGAEVGSYYNNGIAIHA